MTPLLQTAVYIPKLDKVIYGEILDVQKNGKSLDQAAESILEYLKRYGVKPGIR